MSAIASASGSASGVGLPSIEADKTVWICYGDALDLESARRADTIRAYVARSAFSERATLRAGVARPDPRLFVLAGVPFRPTDVHSPSSSAGCVAAAAGCGFGAAAAREFTEARGCWATPSFTGAAGAAGTIAGLPHGRIAGAAAALRSRACCCAARNP